MGHLWYLSESLVALAFFDAAVSPQEKKEMVAALSNEGKETPPPRVKIDENAVSEKKLSHFVSKNTKKFFVAMDISQEFLLSDPTTWESNEDYTRARCKVEKLKVVNDAAERGVALIRTLIRC